MSDGKRMELKDAKARADIIEYHLSFHCERVQIAGSIRRQKETCGDIEIVCIPKPYDVGLFASGVATVVDQWEKVKGELPCKYTQRILPCGTKLDLFFATPENFGLILAIRTGSADFSKFLACRWVANGYHSKDGHLTKDGQVIQTPEEIDIFNICGVEYIEPIQREQIPKWS